jgi:ABC-type transport system involved in cytochrome bd biosynthesis fused ATPase/permease subunit
MEEKEKELKELQKKLREAKLDAKIAKAKEELRIAQMSPEEVEEELRAKVAAKAAQKEQEDKERIRGAILQRVVLVGIIALCWLMTYCSVRC